MKVEDEILSEITDLLIKVLGIMNRLENRFPKRIQSAAICISRALEFVNDKYGTTEEAIKEHKKLMTGEENIENKDKDKLN